jgi:hypothetical protein
MDSAFKTLVNQMVQDHGMEIFGDTRGFNSVLADYARGEYGGEIRLLTTILEAGFYQEFTSNNNHDKELVKSSFLRRLYTQYALDNTKATEMVDILLGVIGIVVDEKPTSPPPAAKPASLSTKPPVQPTPVSVPAGLEYKVEGSTVTITKYKGTATTVMIPATIEGKPVIAIGKGAFKGCSGLTSVTIPSGVTSIRHYTFYRCSGLTSVTIPSGVTSIGFRAFAGCSGLTSVTILSGVTYIGSYAFWGCSGLTSITIPSGVTYIGHSAFKDCSSLTSVTMPNRVRSIEKDAFDGCPWQPPKKGCFITTAVCGSFGKGDDCRELTAFRAFRDNWLAKQPDGQSLITEYYRIAPGIVAAIDKSGNRNAVYRGIWDTYLTDCMRLIENREFAVCKQRYIAMIESLKIIYL